MHRDNLLAVWYRSYSLKQKVNKLSTSHNAITFSYCIQIVQGTDEKKLGNITLHLSNNTIFLIIDSSQ